MIFQLLEDLHRSHRLTSVFVTHNLAFARRCDRVLNLEKGGLVPEVPSCSHPESTPQYPLE
jgi:lipoprotein-releasing system ATP-binding protein